MCLFSNYMYVFTAGYFLIGFGINPSITMQITMISEITYGKLENIGIFGV